MALTKIAGVDILVKVDGTTVGGQRNCTLNLQREVIDTSDKTSSGFKTTIPGLAEWSVEMDQLYVTGDTGYEALQAAFMNRTSVTVVVDVNSAAKSYTGDAYVTNLSLEAPYEGAATGKCTLSAKGALTIA